MATTFKSVQEMLTYDGKADVVEVVRPSGGVLRSASSAPLKLKASRTKKTIFIPKDMEPFTIRLDTNKIDAEGRGMFTLCNFDFWGSPDFQNLTDVDLVSPKFEFPYAAMHKSAKMRALYNDRARALYLQGAKRVGLYAPHFTNVQSGVILAKSEDVTIAGALYDTDFGGPTTSVVHPDFIGVVGGGTKRLHVVDSTIMRYPRCVFQGGTPHVDFLLRNTWLAANIGAPLQFNPDHAAPAGNISGLLKHIRLWFTIAGRKPYRMDAGKFAYTAGSYSKTDKRIAVTETDVQIVDEMPDDEPPHMQWWEQDPLDLARELRNG